MRKREYLVPDLSIIAFTLKDVIMNSVENKAEIIDDGDTPGEIIIESNDDLFF